MVLASGRSSQLTR